MEFEKKSRLNISCASHAYLCVSIGEKLETLSCTPKNHTELSPYFKRSERKVFRCKSVYFQCFVIVITENVAQYTYIFIRIVVYSRSRALARRDIVRCHVALMKIFMHRWIIHNMNAAIRFYSNEHCVLLSILTRWYWCCSAMFKHNFLVFAMAQAHFRQTPSSLEYEYMLQTFSLMLCCAKDKCTVYRCNNILRTTYMFQY